jgi:hypothetical protein
MGLARSTEREVQAVVDQAEAARQEVEVSRQAMQASYRPRLVDVPYGRFVRETQSLLPGSGPISHDDAELRVDSPPPEDRPSNMTIRVPVRNVGTGLALIHEVRLRWHEPGSNVAPDETVYLGLAAPTVLPPSEFTRVSFTFGPEEAQRVASIHDAAAFAVEVRYRDTSGEVSEMTRLDLATRAQQRWRVRQVHLYEDGADAPYASSGVSV